MEPAEALEAEAAAKADGRATEPAAGEHLDLAERVGLTDLVLAHDRHQLLVLVVNRLVDADVYQLLPADLRLGADLQADNRLSLAGRAEHLNVVHRPDADGAGVVGRRSLGLAV